jgi:hypothetical protein
MSKRSKLENGEVALLAKTCAFYIATGDADSLKKAFANVDFKKYVERNKKFQE